MCHFSLRAMLAFFAGAVVLALVTPPTLKPAEAEQKADSASKRLVARRTQSMEALAYANAMDAGVWGSPLVVMYLLRANDALGPKAKAPPNAIWRMENIATPQLSEQAGYVTPNVNTIYGFGFLDLGPEPVILSVPDSKGRYYLVEIVDMWTNAFAYAGGVATGYKGGKFALVGPNWKGTLPADVRRVDSPTRWVMIQPRVHLLGQDDLPEARNVLEAITVQGLAQATGKPALKAPIYEYPVAELTDPKLPVSALALKDPLQFWELLATAMAENPPPEDQVKALLPLFKPLGLEAGKPWDRSRLDPNVLRGLERAIQELPAHLEYVRPPGVLFADGWFSSSPEVGDFKTNYLLRASAARNDLTVNVPREAVYLQTLVDSDGAELTGASRYTVTIKQPPPYLKPGFWSLTMYDFKNNYTVPNPINRYCLGSDNPLKFNDDGSLTLYVQKEKPAADKEANWLPAPPGQFYLTLRAYPPGAKLLESLSDPRAYRRPVVAVVK